MCKLFQMVKLPTIHIGKLSLLLSILVWLSLLFVDLVRLFGIVNDLDSGIPEEITWILEIIFFFTIYGFYTYSIQANSQNDFLNLIWRAASTGIFAAAVALFIDGFYFLVGDSRLGSELFLRNFFYHVNFALISIFLISSALLWKHLMLYQKSKQVVKQWQVWIFDVDLIWILEAHDGKSRSRCSRRVQSSPHTCAPPHTCIENAKMLPHLVIVVGHFLKLLILDQITPQVEPYGDFDDFRLLIDGAQYSVESSQANGGVGYVLEAEVVEN